MLAHVLKHLLDASILEEPHLDTDIDSLRPFTFPEEEVNGATRFVEGAVRQVQVNTYERNDKARRQCIHYHGARCAACGFDFAKIYGSSMDGFIHVHHLRPLAEIGEAYEVDPVRNLLPVCPNCHAVIHRTPQTLSIEDVRKLIRIARQRESKSDDRSQG